MQFELTCIITSVSDVTCIGSECQVRPKLLRTFLGRWGILSASFHTHEHDGDTPVASTAEAMWRS